MIIDWINETDTEVSDHLIGHMQKAIDAVLHHEGFSNPGEVSVTFVTNERIRVLNKEYRNKDSVTDVLSFPQYDQLFSEPRSSDYLCLGDVVISLDRAKEQAMDFGHSFEREVVYLTVHSILHLLGYDHLLEDEQRTMRAKEKDILKALNIFK